MSVSYTHLIGEDKDCDGIGYPVSKWKKPAVGRTYPPCAPQTSDDFTLRSLGKQWQWNANPKIYWYYPAGERSNLRLFTVYQEGDSVYKMCIRDRWSNVGEVFNEGVELEIRSVNIKNKKFSWNTNFKMCIRDRLYLH